MTWKKAVGAVIAAAATWVVLAVPAGAQPVEVKSGPATAVPLTSAGQAAPARDLSGRIGVAGALGCVYPYACLYNANDVKVEQYKVVTSGWQAFKRTDVYYAVNTRNDDVVYIRYTNGNVGCLAAGNASIIWDLRVLGVPNGIRIDSSSVCFP